MFISKKRILLQLDMFMMKMQYSLKYTILIYNDIIMCAMASKITDLTIVYSSVFSGADQRKHRSSMSLAFVRELTGEFRAQMASNAENFSIWWCHHGCGKLMPFPSKSPCGWVINSYILLLQLYIIVILPWACGNIFMTFHKCHINDVMAIIQVLQHSVMMMIP